jgi:hypothetical protein
VKDPHQGAVRPAAAALAAVRPAAVGLATACAVLLAAGCASSQPPKPAVPQSAVPAAAHTSAPVNRPSMAATMTAAKVRLLANRYLTVAQPANRQLDHDFDGLQDNRDNDLAAADAYLRDATATERRFDRQLIAIAFPAQTEPIVRLLYQVNQARAALTEQAAAATSLRQLSGYQQRLTAANGPVEQAVTVIRSQLGLPPPDTS